MTSLVFMLLDVPVPPGHAPRGLGDRGRDLCVEDAEVGVHRGGRALDGGEGADELAFDGCAGDREVLDGALGLGPPLRPGRDADLAHGVVLDAVLGGVLTGAVLLWAVLRGHAVLPDGVDGDCAPKGP
jgi:hypothetical protein